MEIFEKILGQSQAVRLPMFAVTLTAIPCANTPVLLVLHWHGWLKVSSDRLPVRTKPEWPQPVPGSALQVSDPWRGMEHLDDAMLDAAWQFGAWELVREERRGCEFPGSSEREALECRQAFADDPFVPGREDHLVAEAPDRLELMQMAARVGYVRWQFRPVRNGLWREVAGGDDTLTADGGRTPPCPVRPSPAVGPKVSQTRYRLGQSDRLILG